MRPVEDTLLQDFFKVSHFRDLSDSDKQTLSRFAQAQVYDAGEYIVREGDADESVYFIIEGSAEVLRHGETDKEFVVATLDQGAIFGEMAFLSAAPRSAGVKALSETRVLTFSKVSFHTLCQAEPALGLLVLEKISKATSLRLRNVSRELRVVLALSKRHRLIAALAISALIVVVAWSYHYLWNLGRELPPPVMTAMEALGEEKVLYTAELGRYGSTEVTSSIEGTVHRILFEDGQEVEENQPLVLLRNEQIEKEAREAETAVSESGSESSLKRRAQMAYFTAQAKLSRLTLRAPHDGTIHTYGAVALEEHKTLHSGDVAAVIHRPGRYGFHICVPPDEITRYPIGLSLRFRIKENPSLEFFAQVVTVESDMGPEACHNVVLHVLPLPDESVVILRSGLTCEIIGSREDLE